MITKFTVSKDPDYGFIVHQVSAAFSFANIPVDHNWSFQHKGEAIEQAKLLSSLDNVAVRMIETPERFEAVADTKYGAAWG